MSFLGVLRRQGRKDRLDHILKDLYDEIRSCDFCLGASEHLRNVF